MADIRDILRKQAIAMGMDPTHALTVASIESSFDPRAGAGKKHKGLYQMGPGEWDKYGSGDVFDPVDNFNSWAAYQGDQKNELTQKLGRPPTPQELYLASQQGAAGSTALLQNPDMPVVDALSKAYRGNREEATKAVLANGGAPDMTAAQFSDKWRQTYDKHKAALGGGDASDPAEMAGLNGGLLGDSKYINGPGAGAGPAMAAAPLPDPKADWDLAGYGSSPPMDAVAVASKGGPNFNAMALGGGQALLAAGQPQEQWRPNMQRLPDSPIHKPKLGLLGEINPYGQPIWGRGLLG